MNSIEDKLKKMIVKASRINISENDINEKINLVDDLQLDSIDVMKLIIDIENQFSILFNEEDLLLDNLSSYGNLLNYIMKLTLKDIVLYLNSFTADILGMHWKMMSF